MLALSAAPASAIELPVDYQVYAKNLKADAPAGTVLTFELHTDPTCNSAFYTAPIAIEAVEVAIEQVKLAKVSGGPTPPKSATIHTVLTGVPASAQIWLK